MRKVAVLASRVDAVCARLNDGLLAVATVLAVLTIVVSVVRTAELMSPTDSEWAALETSH